jgi:hypothetical protein
VKGESDMGKEGETAHNGCKTIIGTDISFLALCVDLPKKIYVVDRELHCEHAKYSVFYSTWMI